MKKAFKIISLIMALALCLSIFGCSKGKYKDTINRPEIEMPEKAPQLSYPAKPATPPSAPAQGAVPAVTAYTASEANSTYTVAKEGDVTRITYTDVTNWAYVYVSVKDYTAEYGNIKITLNNVTEKNGAAERIAVQAVYYEAYDLGYSPVTVHVGPLGEGEQYVITSLGDYMITDKFYQPVQGESVRNKTVIGFVVFIDSLPSYAPLNDKSGSLDIINFQFLKDGDPALDDRYVKPVPDFENATADSGIDVVKDEDGLTATYGAEGSVYIPLGKYTSDFAKFKLALSGSGDLQVGVKYSLGSGENVTFIKTVTLNATATEEEFDFTSLHPATGNDDNDMRYVKNLAVTALVIKGTNGNAAVSEITFIRTANDGAVLSAAWSSSNSNVTVSNAATGGNAKITYKYHHDDWQNISIPVSNGSGVKKIVFTFYAPDGLRHMGIGIVNNSAFSSQGQSATGTFIIRNAGTLFDGVNTSVIANQTAQNLVGIKESFTYDEGTKIYTLTYDFTSMAADANNKKFEDYTISNLLLYLTCPCAGANQDAHKFDGTHSIYFISVDFITK